MLNTTQILPCPSSPSFSQAGRAGIRVPILKMTLLRPRGLTYSYAHSCGQDSSLLWSKSQIPSFSQAAFYPTGGAASSHWGCPVSCWCAGLGTARCRKSFNLPRPQCPHQSHLLVLPFSPQSCLEHSEREIAAESIQCSSCVSQLGPRHHTQEEAELPAPRRNPQPAALLKPHV